MRPAREGERVGEERVELVGEVALVSDRHVRVALDAERFEQDVSRRGPPPEPGLPPATGPGGDGPSAELCVADVGEQVPCRRDDRRSTFFSALTTRPSGPWPVAARDSHIPMLT